MASYPRAVSMLWPDLEDGPWLVTVWWRVQHGTAEAIGLEMTSWVDEDWEKEQRDFFRGTLHDVDDEERFPVIDSQFFKKMPVGTVLQTSRKLMLTYLSETTSVDADPWDDPEEFARLVEERRAEAPAFDTAGPRSTRDLGDAHYREVAETYKQAARAGDPPTVAVAERFHLSKSAAAKQVARAREREFLPKTTRGRVGNLEEDV